MSLFNKKNNFFSLSLVGIVIIICQGCSPATHTDSGASASSFSSPLTDGAMKVIDKHCVSCHGSGASKGGFTGIKNLSYMVATGLIVPGDPVNSPLNRMVESNSMPTTYGLEDGDKVILEDWVLSLAVDGAPTNDPFCIVTTDKLAISSGETLALTIVVVGAADSATLDGQSVLVSGETIFATPTQDTTFTGSVTWADGSSTCSSPLIVVN